MLPAGGSRTFKDYAMKVFLPYVCNHLKYVERLDIVWDRYFSNSLKKSTRSNRGAGIRLRVTGNGLLPKDWLSFLRCSENKKELFPYISQQIIDQADTTKLLITTFNENALCNQNIEIENLMSCNLEEADERIFLHVQHAAKTYESVLVKTVDSDIVVIALYAYQHIQNLNELWIEFGVGKSLQFIPIHEISNGLGPSVCNAYLFFHSFSGCDTTSSCSGRGKKSFHETWKLLPELTPIFDKLSSIANPEEILTDDYKTLERFIVTLYSSTINTEEVDVARRILFTTRSRSVENIPPTSEALKQHVKRSALQAIKWCRCISDDCSLLDPLLWGWRKKDDGFFTNMDHP